MAYSVERAAETGIVIKENASHSGYATPDCHID